MAGIRFLLVAAVLVLALCEFSLAGKIRPQSNKYKRDVSSSPATVVSDELFAVEDQQEESCINVLTNDVNHFGVQDVDTSSLRIFSQAKHGWASFNELTLELCYIPDENFNGNDWVVYSACSTTGLCENAVVRVTVSPINDAPITRPDYAVVGPEEDFILVDVLANDEDVDGPYITRGSLRILSPPTYGGAWVTADRKIGYSPIWSDDNHVRFYGSDTIAYEICDNADPELCSWGVLNIDVLDACIACVKCWDFLPTFNEHRDRIDYFFHKDIHLSRGHHGHNHGHQGHGNGHSAHEHN